MPSSIFYCIHTIFYIIIYWILFEVYFVKKSFLWHFKLSTNCHVLWDTLQLIYLNSSLISNSVILKTLWCIRLHYTYCAVPTCRTAEPWVNTGHMCSAHLSCKGGTVPTRISAKNTKIVWGGKLFKRTVHVISCAQTLEKMYSWFTNLYLMSKMSKISLVFYLKLD